MKYPMCAAKIPYKYRRVQCSKRGKHECLGEYICSLHKRQFDKWDKEGRAESMAEFYWSLKRP